MKCKGVTNVAIVIDVMCARLRDVTEGTQNFM